MVPRVDRWVVQLQADMSGAGDTDPTAAVSDALKQFEPVPVLGQAGAVRVSVRAETLVEAEATVTVALHESGVAVAADVVSVVRYTPTAELPTAEIPEV
jgi:hypothetical protein